MLAQLQPPFARHLAQLFEDREDNGANPRWLVVYKLVDKAAAPAPNPVLSTLRYFNEEYKAYLEGGPSYARKMSSRTQAPEPTREPAKAAAAP